jgi:hypothetical protein
MPRRSAMVSRDGHTSIDPDCQSTNDHRAARTMRAVGETARRESAHRWASLIV